MVPVVLDIAKLRLAIAGEGAGALKRLHWLKRHGGAPVAVFAPVPSAVLRAESGDALIERWPEPADLATLHVLFAVGLPEAEAGRIAEAARAAKTVLNVEDAPALCDIHVPASVRRGDLLLTASTGGRAPGLSRKLAHWLGARFGAEWETRIDEIAAERAAFRRAGLAGAALSKEVDRYLDRKGWLA